MKPATTRGRATPDKYVILNPDRANEAVRPTTTALQPIGRQIPVATERLPWLADDAEPNADMWASATESRAEIVGLYRRAWAHTDATIATLPLDSVARVPW